MRVALKTQAAAAVALLALFSVGSGLAFLVQAEAQSDLEESMRRELFVLLKLPQLRERLRGVDESSNAYLLSGGAVWLNRRQEALKGLREAQKDLSAVSGLEREASYGRFERGLEAYLSQQSLWIADKASGQLAPVDAEKIAERGQSLERALGELLSARDQAVAALDARLAASRAALRWMVALIMGTGALSAATLAWLLSRSILHPVLGLERAARDWQLGRAWERPRGGGGPEVESLAAVMRDMAERLNRQFEKELEVGRFKSQLVALVSHEFNNALNVIQGVAALLEETEGKSTPERRREFYDMLKSNARALAIASTNLLNMGRLESGRFALRPRKADVASLLRETAQRQQILSQRKRLSVALELPDPAPWLRADPEALTLVATNLLSNAIKYTPEGGRVALGLERLEGGRARVYCRDSGIGIAAEDRERIYSGYYRTERGRAAAAGFGVGLPLAKKIVEAHDSDLELESEVGRGSTFSFVLKEWDGGQGGTEES